jgi:hypothetical protein
MKTGSRDRLLEQLRLNLDSLSTEELLRIWQEHDSAEWTDEAFEAIAEILTARTGSLPSPGEAPAADEATEPEHANEVERATARRRLRRFVKPAGWKGRVIHPSPDRSIFPPQAAAIERPRRSPTGVQVAISVVLIVLLISMVAAPNWLAGLLSGQRGGLPRVPARDRRPAVVPAQGGLTAQHLQAANLTLADLPSGFALPEQDLVEQVPGLAGFDAHFYFRDPASPTVVFGGLTRAAPADFQQWINAPETVQALARAALGDRLASVEVIENACAAGEQRLFLSLEADLPNGTVRAQELLFARAPVLALVTVVYPKGGRPSVAACDLADALDQRLLDLLRPAPQPGAVAVGGKVLGGM